MQIAPDVQTQEDTVKDEDVMYLYGKPLHEPILGKHFELPGKSAIEQPIELDVSSSFTPVFTHLKVHDTGSLERPSTPPVIRRIANESYMEFYEPLQVRTESIKSGTMWGDILKPGRRSTARTRESLFLEKFNKK